MKTVAVRPPHLERLVARVRTLDAPVVQLWAWPGAGQQAVLDALVEDARWGQPLSLDDLADEVSLVRAVAAAFEGGAHWLVLPAVPALPGPAVSAIERIARRLEPGRRLVFAAAERHVGPLATACVYPQEMLLTASEVTELWREVTGSPPGPQLVSRLITLTDGWYRPLRLAAETAGEAGGSVEPERLLDEADLSSFLRHEVLGMLSVEEQELLVRLAAGGRLGPELWDELLSPDDQRLRRRLLEVWGLGLEDRGSLRLPHLLRWFLSRERRERWPTSRRRRLAARLAAVELEQDRLVPALEHFLEAERQGPVAQLLTQAWPQLFATASLGLLGRTFARLPEIGAAGGAAGLLRGVTEALLWQAEGDPAAALAALAAASDDPAVTATAGTAAALLALPGAHQVPVSPGPVAAPPIDPRRPAVPPSTAGSSDTPASALPAGLRPLWELLAVARRLDSSVAHGRVGRGGRHEAPVPGDLEAEDAAAAALLPALETVAVGLAPRARDRGRVRGATPLRGLFERALLDLLDRHPALAGALVRRPDLPAAWRRWLAALSVASLVRTPSGYAVALFGKPAVTYRRDRGPGVEVDFALERAFLAFAYLATSPDFAASRDELRGALWEDEDEVTIDKNFHPTLSYLRRALEAAQETPTAVRPLLLRRQVYRLNPRLPWHVDSVSLVRWSEEGRRRLGDGHPEQALALWRAAWSLYTGPLLADHDAPWIVERRAELQRTYVELLRHYGETAERLGRLTEAMDAFRTALIEDPSPEPVHLALMRIYARQGRRDHVRRQYERLVAQLREENSDPLAETEATYHRLMS